MNFSKSKILKERAKSRLDVLRVHKAHRQMNRQHFNLLDYWYLLPVIEPISKGQTIKDVSKSLFLTTDEVKKAVQLLLKNNYLNVDEKGNYFKFEDHIRFESPCSDENVKNYHKNFLDLSSKKLFAIQCDLSISIT